MKKLIWKCALLLFIVGTVLYAGGAACKQTTTYRNTASPTRTTPTTPPSRKDTVFAETSTI